MTGPPKRTKYTVQSFEVHVGKALNLASNDSAGNQPVTRRPLPLPAVNEVVIQSSVSEVMNIYPIEKSIPNTYPSVLNERTMKV